MEHTLRIDEEFRNKIPPLTDEEFKQLEQNILDDGEVHTPIVVWNGIIVDGHNRWNIIQKHPEIPYKIKEMDFADKWAAFDWMYKNQLGRRNLTDEQRTYLLGKLYEARKHSVGGQHGNQNASKQMRQNGAIEKERLSIQIAKEQGVGQKTVERAEHFAKGIDAIKEVDTEVADDILNGKKKITKQSIIYIKNASPAETKKVVKAIKDGTYKRKPKVQTPEDKKILDEIQKDVETSRTVTTAYTISVDDCVRTMKDNITPYVNMMNHVIDAYMDVIKTDSEQVIKVIDDCINELTKMKERIENV